MKKAVAVIAFALLVLWFCVIVAWSVADVYQRPRFSSVNDKPVTESMPAIKDARVNGYCAFHVGDEFYIVKNMPEEYLKYSEWYCRMP